MIDEAYHSYEKIKYKYGTDRLFVVWFKVEKFVKMAFFQWRYFFDEIFEDCSDRWRLSYVHRNDSNRIQALEGSREFSRQKFAWYISCFIFLSQ